MAKARILYIIWLMFIVIFFIVSESPAGLTALIISVATAVVAVISSRIGSRGVTVAAEALLPDGIAITASNASAVPSDNVTCRVKAENLLTGEIIERRIGASLPAKGECRRLLSVASGRCGRVEVTVNTVTVGDIFGLTGRELPQTGVSCRTFFKPSVFPIDFEILYGESLSLDSDVYSMRKPGSDPSETFAIREYRAGDRVKQIHWKLTEKLDDLVVREYGLPIQNTVLIALETGLGDGEEADPECMNALASAAASLSQALAENGVTHSFAGYDHRGAVLTCSEITNEDDLQESLPDIFSSVPGRDKLTVPDHYLEEHERCEFAHIVVFTPSHRPALESYAETGIVTEVIVSRGGGYDAGVSGINVIAVRPGEIETALAYMEI